ncbi:MAG: SemiSWEET transporter [Kofleriaceae bacterium]
MSVATVIGYLASVASITSFLPQAWRIIKTRKTKDLSAAMFAVTAVGFALWTTYGILLGEAPIVLTNSVCCALSSFILMMKLLPRRRRDAIADALDPSHEG